MDNDYPDHDTEWATSAKGNEWRGIDGKVLVVGYSRTAGKYWAMCDGDFAEGTFSTRRRPWRPLSVCSGKGLVIIGDANHASY